MKRFFLMFLTVAISITLSACGCKHEWIDAACDTPKSCTLCGETEGETLPHTWKEATCTTPKYCEVCGIVEGDQPAGHQWEDPENGCFQVCSLCGTIGGEQKEHQWAPATCTAPKTCTVCGTTEGECSPHIDFDRMNTAGEKVMLRCECGQEEDLTAEELMLRMLQGKWTLMAVQVDGQYYLPEPQTNWEEGTWLEFPSAEEPFGYQAGISAQANFVIPHTLSDFQAGGVAFYNGGRNLPIVQCQAMPDSSDGSAESSVLRVVLGIRDYDPESFEIADFITSALDGYILCLWRYTEDTNYLYAYSGA